MSFVRFLSDRKASITPLVALTIVPLMGAIGAAVDYSRASSARTAMQNSLDATALMLSKNASGWDPATIQAKATAYFNANFSDHPEATNVSVTATYTQNGGSTVVINGSGTVGTLFLKTMGLSDIPLTASSTVVWNTTRLRVALVLDNTGSMTQKDSTGTTKISALKTAAHNLLTTLQNAAQSTDDVYVSIIPFSKDVNVGASNYSQTWIDWSDWDDNNGTCNKSGYNSKSTCTSHHVCSISGYTSQTSCTGAGVCSKSSYTSQTSCTGHSGTWTWGTWNLASWTPKDHSTWNGCVTDRTQNYDTLNTTPSSGGTLFPAEQYDSCSTELLSMTNDWTTLGNKVDAMTPTGNTNQAIGLAWGWQALTSGNPLNTPAKDSTHQYQDVIILLTDGLNTEDRWYTSASSIDNRQSIACSNAKAAGITIYTVLVMSGDSDTLQSCASDASKYFALTNANQIVTTFNQIGNVLAQLHISK